MDDSVIEHIAVEQLSEWTFRSKRLMEAMGNTLPIAYGGYTLGMATNAAAKTVTAGFHLYSVMGHYLGPTSTKERVTLTVSSSRSTKTFQTRRVQVTQDTGNGKPRVCLELLADFQRAEPAELLNYSAAPLMKYTHWKECLPVEEMTEKLVADGKITPADAKAFNKTFGLSHRVFNSRYCPESVAAQNLLGVAKKVQTTQDHLPIMAKTSASWFQSKYPVSEESDHVAGLAFMLDGGLSFLPLTHNHMFLNDASACSSLDFAMRIFVPVVNLNEWHLRESVTHVGSHGRTFSESKVWDEKGNMVATMTQQSIMRPHPPNKL